MLDEVQCAALWQYAEDIRAEVPIAGVTATNAEAVARDKLIRSVRDSWDEESGESPDQTRHVWHSVQFVSGKVAGRWSYDETDAALNCMVWWGEPARYVVEDSAMKYHASWKLETGDVRIDLDSGDLVPAGGLLDGLGDW